MLPVRAIPGPRALPLVGNLVGFARDPLRFQLELVERYGPLVRYRLGTQSVVLVTTPELVRDVFAADSSQLTKGRALGAAKRIVGEGLITAEGEHHLRSRRMLAPLFQPAALGRYADATVELTAEEVARWPRGEFRDVAHDMTALTLRIIARVLFHGDVKDAGAIGRAMEDCLRLVARLTIPGYAWLEGLPLPSHRRFRRARAFLDQEVYRLIELRRGKSIADVAGPDLLSLLLAAQDPEGGGGGLSDVEVRDEVMTLFLAGHDTTANGMAWLLHLIGTHPEVDRQIATELAEVVGGRLPRFDDVAKLPRLRGAILEALRLRPPVWNVARRTAVPFQLGDHLLPAGTVIIVSPWVSHHLEESFPDPTRFDPDRWLDADPRKTHRHRYVPFGGGRRVCIGEQFAMLEMTLIAATALQACRIEALEPDVRAEATITIRPKGGVQARIHAR